MCTVACVDGGEGVQYIGDKIFGMSCAYMCGRDISKACIEIGDWW